MKPRKFDDSKMTCEDGVNVTKDTVAKFPSSVYPFTIQVVNGKGDVIESVDIDGSGADSARWNELRDMMPDDALYFQPDKAGDKKQNSTAKNIQPFNVYRNYDRAKNTHKDCELNAFTGCGIRQPVFLDVKEPTFYWNNLD